MEPLEIGAALLTSVAGIALLTGVINEGIKRAWNPDGPTQDRWMPVLNLVTGTILGLVGAAILPQLDRVEILNGAIIGLFGGAAAGGLYDLVRGLRKTSPDA